MKKKTMRALFVTILVLGVIIGWLIPGDLKSLMQKASGNQLKPAIIEIPKKLGQLEYSEEAFKYSVLAQTDLSMVQLVRLEGDIPTHIHPHENHFIYIYKGKAKLKMFEQEFEVGPGTLVVVPSGVPHSVQKIGDTPTEALIFSSPPTQDDDTIWIDKK